MAESHRHFIPAAGHDWLLPLYDPLLRLLGGESARGQLIEQASIRSGQRVLDLGCGTGGLALLLKRLHPDVAVVGIDPDPKALARARRKAMLADLSIRLDEGFADALPYVDQSFDRVLSSFVFHHLASQEKPRALAEVRRVLRPGGSLHVLDFSGSGGWGGSRLARWLQSAASPPDQDPGGMPGLMQAAGFRDAREVAHRITLFGRAAYYAASLAGDEAAPAG